eukprot:2058337-Pleurochrysis_carterae.AAC.1
MTCQTHACVVAVRRMRRVNVKCGVQRVSCRCGRRQSKWIKAFAARWTLERTIGAARLRRLDGKTQRDVSWRHARPAMSMAMQMQTLMMKAAAAKAARIQRTLEMDGVQATATSASSSDA